MLSRGYNEDTITGELKSGAIYWVTLLHDNKLIGFASYGPIDNTEEMQLYKLYIHPCFQREGHGTAFLQYLQKEASENGYKYLILTVNKNNVKAISVYSKSGFVIRETRVTDIGGGFFMDDYVMSSCLVR